MKRNSLNARYAAAIRPPKRQGATLVEVAMVVPVILFVLFGSIEFARMLMIRQALTNAAREGCRDASLAIRLDSSDSENLIRQQLRKVIIGATNTGDNEVLRVTISPAFTNGVDSLTPVYASVEVDCADISWFPLTMFSGAKVRCSASMIRE